MLLVYGYHTNSDGHFDPKPDCCMGLRYKVKQVLDTNGQSSTVVLAEVRLNTFKLSNSYVHSLINVNKLLDRDVTNENLVQIYLNS